MDRTALLTVSVPRNFLHEFITVRKPWKMKKILSFVVVKMLH
jgi:hypothetical protein